MLAIVSDIELCLTNGARQGSKNPKAQNDQFTIGITGRTPPFFMTFITPI